jgi:hypothetical protein
MILNKPSYFCGETPWEEVPVNVGFYTPWAKNNELFYQKMGPFPVLIFTLAGEGKERFLVAIERSDNYILLRVCGC